jgi:hypothetical protein
MYEPFVQGCVSKPQYQFLERAYNDYRMDSKPCKQGAENQCAVRMSIALGRAGFGLESFQPSSRVHKGGKSCQTNGMAHVLGAEELARFLRQALFAPVVFQPGAKNGCAGAFQTVQRTRGILYFNNCFKRKGETHARGDHIDLFNGLQYYNQIIHPKAGGDETTGGDLFGRADQVWFWQL